MFQTNSVVMKKNIKKAGCTITNQGNLAWITFTAPASWTFEDVREAVDVARGYRLRKTGVSQYVAEKLK